MEQLDKILSLIKEMNSSQLKNTSLEEISVESPTNPFKILIGTILSQRTRDQNTKKAVNQLFSFYHNASELARGNLKTIEKLIKPAGFYRVKARRIKEVSKIIINKFDGKVPDNLDQLLSLPSVGRKTANCVLVYGFNKPAIPVDTHVHRISNRLGLVKTKSPVETEFALSKIFNKKFWVEVNESFVKFGQIFCKPVNPKCDICKLRKKCLYYFRMKEVMRFSQ